MVAADWVVTAAHCVADLAGTPMDPTAVTVVAGEYDRAAADGTEQQRAVSQVIVHPGYSPRSSAYDNDIALLHLESPVDVSHGSLGAIPLLTSPADDSLAAPDTLATVSGWGTTAEGGSLPAVLYKVQVPIVSNAVCNSSSSYNGQITANMLCAGYASGGKDTCQGDSGGPLVVPAGSGWRLAGVTSFGSGCARPDYYGVYTRVSRYVDWIDGYLAAAETAPTPTPTPEETATPTDTGAIIKNGGFEAGDNGDWVERSTSGETLLQQGDGLAGIEPHAGAWAARLGQDNNTVSAIYQEITLPVEKASLTYFYQIRSRDVCGFNEATVSVTDLSTDAAGAPAAVLAAYDLCADKEVAAWRQVWLDLGAYAGRRVGVQFTVTTDAASPSSFYLDDVAVTPDNDAPPAPTAETGPSGQDAAASYLPIIRGPAP